MPVRGSETLSGPGFESEQPASEASTQLGAVIGPRPGLRPDDADCQCHSPLARTVDCQWPQRRHALFVAAGA